MVAQKIKEKPPHSKIQKKKQYPTPEKELYGVLAIDLAIACMIKLH
jgi:hypothetical protein